MTFRDVTADHSTASGTYPTELINAITAAGYGLNIEATASEDRLKTLDNLCEVDWSEGASSYVTARDGNYVWSESSNMWMHQ